MRKTIFNLARRLLPLLLLPPALAFGQFTTVSGTVIDPNGIPYAGGTITAKLVLSGVTPTLNGGSFSMTGSAGLSKAGSFTMNLADNSVMVPNTLQWSFTVCSAIGTVNPAIGTGSQCFTPAPITISGSSQSISTQLQAAALALTMTSGSSPCPTCITGSGTSPNAAYFTGTQALGSFTGLTISGGALTAVHLVAANNLFTLTPALQTATEASPDAFSDALIFQKARGTIASPAVPVAGDFLGSIFFEGYNGTTYSGASAIFRCYAAETWSGTANGSYCATSITPAGGLLTAVTALNASNGGSYFGTPAPTAAGLPSGALYGGFDVNGNLTAGSITSTTTNTFETFSQFFTAPWDGLQLTSAAGSVGSSIDLRNSNGTIAVPTALTVGQELGAITFDGYDGTAFSISPAAAKINAKVGENWTSSAHGTYILFNSTPDTTTSAVTRGLVDGLGNWEFGAPGGGPLPTGTAYAEFDINGNLIKPESTAPSGIASSDILYADSTAHRWKMLNNNTSGLDLVGIASAGTSGNCLQLAANGIDITDSGSACGGGGAVSSVFGRTGAVVATSGDYTLNQIGAPTATVGPWNFASNAMTFNWGAAAGSSQFAFSTTGAPAFQLLNPTSVAAVTNSPTLTIGGAYQNAGTPTFAADTWTIQSIIGSGTNGTSSLEYVHSGTTGAAGVYFPAGLPSSNIPGIGLAGTGSSGFGLGFDQATNGISFVLSGSFPFEIRSQQVVLRSNTSLAYTNGGTNGTIDTTLCRLSGGTVEIGSSTGCAASGSLSATNFTASGSINVTNPLISHTAPTISSGFGTGASVTANNGTAAFRINVGTSNTGNGVIGLPTATTGWNCYATDITTTSTTVSQTKTTGSTTATATLQNYTDISGTGAWTDSDVLAVSCFAY